MRHQVRSDQVKLSLAESEGKPANSPYGAWVNLLLPIGDNEKLRAQYRLFDLNTLRMSKILELLDMLAYDSAKMYISQIPEHDQTYFLTTAMGGFQF